jgi:Holliday junction resolvase
MGPELAFGKRVVAALKSLGCDIERIENRINAGVPDLLIGIGERFVMVELKRVQHGHGSGVKISPHQVAFHIRHSRKGRPCFVLIHRDEMLTKPGFIALYRGEDAIKLYEEGLNVEPLAKWGIKDIDWQELLGHLSGEKKE